MTISSLLARLHRAIWSRPADDPLESVEEFRMRLEDEARVNAGIKRALDRTEREDAQRGGL